MNPHASFAHLAELFPDAHVTELAPVGRPRAATPDPTPPAQPMVHTSLTATPRAPDPGFQPTSAASSGLSSVTPDQIRLTLKKARHEDYFALLEIRKSADLYEIEQAYRRASSRFSASQVGHPVADHYFADLQEIREALDDAYGVLGSEALRTAYLRGLLNQTTG